MNTKELIFFVTKNRFNTDNTHEWIDFTKKLIKKFKLETVVNDEKDTTCIEIHNKEKVIIEAVYSVAKDTSVTLEYVFSGHVTYK